MSNTADFTQLQPDDTLTDYNSIAFIIKRHLARVRTATPVSVVSCTNNGGVSPIGTVVVQPLVNMLDSQGNSQAHGNINNVPYFRFMGGMNGAIICDPVAGDTGLLVVCDRDISAVQSTAAAANPGSYRRFDLADGFYIGGFLGKGTPKCYIQFDGQGNIVVNDTTGNQIALNTGGIGIGTSKTPAIFVQDSNGNVINLSSSGIGIGGANCVDISISDKNGNIISLGAGGVGITASTLAVVGNITATGAIHAGQGGADQVGLQTHVHSATNTPPTAGT